MLQDDFMYYYIILFYILSCLFFTLKLIRCFKREFNEITILDLLIAIYISLIPVFNLIILSTFSKQVRKTPIADYIFDKINHVLNIRIS